VDKSSEESAPGLVATRVNPLRVLICPWNKAKTAGRFPQGDESGIPIGRPVEESAAKSLSAKLSTYDRFVYKRFSGRLAAFAHACPQRPIL